MTIETALEGLYEALNKDDNNASVEGALFSLRDAMKDAGEKSVEIENDKLPNNTREGRRMLKSYAKKRGVAVTFPK